MYIYNIYISLKRYITDPQYDILPYMQWNNDEDNIIMNNNDNSNNNANDYNNYQNYDDDNVKDNEMVTIR